MAESFIYDVFSRHSAKDKPVVGELAERLKRGWLLRVWFDEWEIQSGDMVSLRIEEGSERCCHSVMGGYPRLCFTQPVGYNFQRRSGADNATLGHSFSQNG